MTAVAQLTANQVSDETFYDARHIHLASYAEYALRQPVLASSTL